MNHHPTRGASSSLFFDYKKKTGAIPDRRLPARHFDASRTRRRMHLVLEACFGRATSYRIHDPHFDNTTRAQCGISARHGLGIPCHESKENDSLFPFQGNMDLEALKGLVARPSYSCPARHDYRYQPFRWWRTTREHGKYSPSRSALCRTHGDDTPLFFGCLSVCGKRLMYQTTRGGVSNQNSLGNCSRNVWLL